MMARDEDHNRNPDFEHEEVPQWALGQWERETRDRQEGVASSATGGGASAATGDGAATGGGASAATGDGAATGGGNGGTTCGTEELGNLPPASRDVRLILAARQPGPPGGGNGAYWYGTLTPPGDTHQAALDAAPADKHTLEWASRVPWWFK